MMQPKLIEQTRSIDSPASNYRFEHSKNTDGHCGSDLTHSKLPKTRSALTLSKKSLTRNGRSTTFPIGGQPPKSCVNLADMRNSIVNSKATSPKKGVRRTLSSQALKAISRTTRRSSSSKYKEIEPDSEFFSMICFNPSDPQERSKYNDCAVKKYIRRHPEALKVTYDFQVGGRGRLTVARYPVYALVALGASLSTIKLALKANPEAVMATNDFNSTLLHAACSIIKVDMEVVRYIYAKYPAAISKTTRLVYLPLHNACQSAAPSFDLIQFLVEEYPEGLMAITKLGDTPLRSAQRNKGMPATILNFLETETSRLFDLEENSKILKSVQERQSWGSICVSEDEFDKDESSIDSTEDETDGFDLPRTDSLNSVVSPCA